MRRLARTFLCVSIVVAAISLMGCAIYPGTARPASLEDLRREEGWILLDAVPFVPQVSPQGCGAACLAMVLDHWGSGAPAETLERECAVAGRDGIRASDLRDAARRRGLSAYLFQGTLADIHHELSRGRPVVVGVLRPRGDGFSSHFEVVVGLHPERGRIAALDPAIGLTCDSLAGFEDEWLPAMGVTLVVFLHETNEEVTRADGWRRGGGPGLRAEGVAVSRGPGVRRRRRGHRGVPVRRRPRHPAHHLAQRLVP